MGGGSSGSAPTPPPYHPINVGQTQTDATNADIAGYNWSDQNFLSRFPGLVAGRNQQMTDAYNQLNGPLDPTVQNSFVSQGLSNAMGSFGGGDESATLGDTQSGMGANTVAKTVANDTQNKQDYDRNYFESLIAQNPQRSFGLSGSGISNLDIANVLGQDTANQASYGGLINTYNSQNASASAQNSAYISLAASIASAILSSDRRIKKNIKQVGTSPMGIPIKEFEYKGSPDRYRGVVAQDVEKIKPSAVVELGGIKHVHMPQIDVAMKRISKGRKK